MPGLSPEEVTAFLSEPGHLVRVATVDEDGMPRNLPLWFVHHEDAVVFTPRVRSVVHENLARDPRVGLTIDEDGAPYRKVAVQARARMLYAPGRDDEWRDLYREIAYRYVDRQWADAYVDDTIDQPRSLFAVPLRGEGVRVRTWRMPRRGESPTGIWHRRYYLEGTYMAKLAGEGGPD